MLIYTVNSSEISSFGYGVELPIGWQEPAPRADVLCTLEARSDDGLPFSTRRPAQVCLTAHNSLANFINFSMGAVFGALIALAISKIKRRK